MNELSTILKFLSENKDKQKYNSLKKNTTKIKLNNKLKKEDNSVTSLMMFELINKK